MSPSSIDDSLLDRPPLDRCVEGARRDLARAGVPEPDVLLLLGTGLGGLPANLRADGRVPLGPVPGVPRCWRETVLVHGRVGGGTVWLLEDAAEDVAEPGPAWEAAFPLWLAAAAGAQMVVHTSAGVALATDDPVPVGSLVVVSDHVNLSGGTPLLGLGETHLGPLFPDQTTLHHSGLRDRALELAASVGIPLREAVAACTLGPSLDTPAELAWLARTGADVAVQGLAATVLGAAHAGLGLVALVATTDDGARPVRMPALVERSERLAPALEDLVVQLLPAVIDQAQAWAAEEAGAEDEEDDEWEEE